MSPRVYNLNEISRKQRRRSFFITCTFIIPLIITLSIIGGIGGAYLFRENKTISFWEYLQHGDLTEGELEDLLERARKTYKEKQ